MYRLLPLLCAVLLGTVLGACASQSGNLLGTARAPISPDEVRIYQPEEVPEHYERIAILETSSGAFVYGNQNKTNSALNKLRRDAARLGANGVLIQALADGEGGGSGISVGGGGGRIGGRSMTSGGVGVNISARPKHATGIAIYVPSGQ